MAKKVTDGHKVTEAVEKNVAEELISQQNETEEFIIGNDIPVTAEEAEKKEKPGAAENAESDKLKETKVEEVVKASENSFLCNLTLVKAASYADCGMRFFKNVPVSITNKRVYEHLIKTGLFVHS